MDTARLLRTSTTVLAVAGLMLSGCSAGSVRSAAASRPTGAAASDAGPAKRSVAPLAPLPAAIPDALKPYYGQQLTWRDCGTAGFQCATMKAPLDYNHPVAAQDLTLSVARKKATGPGQRIGSLLVNPGGPGGSAVDYAQIAAARYPAPVRARYDIVGMDPRGVARSEPVVCLTDPQMDAFTEVDNDPHSQAEINAITAADKNFANGCEQRSAKLLSHVSTVEAARDMDILRALLGDAKLNYVGKSYGSMLGATYAGLFPSRVGHLVLDGAMDPSLSALDESRTQAQGFETAFQSFVADCVQHTGCPMGQTRAAADQYIVRFLSNLDAHPLRTGQSRQLGESLGTSGLIEAMYAKQLWPVLRDALTSANRGDGGPLLALSDQYYERSADGAYSNLMYANAAVNCLDLPPATNSPADVQAALPSFRKASPHLGPDFAWMSLSCASWPVKATGRPMRIEAKGAGPIVVVGTTRDPATPYDWARSLAGQLSSGTLLTYQGDGHTAYASGDDCVDTAVNRYLLEGITPQNGKTCT
ncbi:alpha/beta hydrolase [Streptantibioticus ferralitis]|uniref:Alpha/beta hydrolase n=1 Tax=Streptantibioticus ferralitis TaxID=236510 RepID=A0ABT5Z047_9ACTN|nr:alpha/beta hydrolase [Streptantibioticus ferralitis]MDF2257228.1 alpha/beta hydrolase [Streptantibioticus ferralitis]